MFARGSIVRFLSMTTKNFQKGNSQKISKEALLALRKRTGYSYVNCRKALVKFGENDMDNAEKWLREAAAKEGWAKAAKLGSRVTTNGLVAVVNDNSTAAIVELSCETDFVARADHFKNLLKDISSSVLHRAKVDLNENESNKLIEKNYDLHEITNNEGVNLRDVLSLAIGKLGENMSIRRLTAYKAPAGTTLYSASHPKDGVEDVQMGRFVSLISLNHQKKNSISSEQLAGQICQHIIGMSPENLGEAPIKKIENGTAVQEGHDPDADPVMVTTIDDSETSLLRQSFMLNPSQSVYDYLVSHNAKISSFVRVELGSE